uniref:Peroxidase n=1 Tax=Megaselia scalaris TaxID=36166 RepID=T1H3N3_MEGSC
MNRQGKYCFDAGDSRANENLLLTSMHLIFARQHNYLARGLQKANPQWSDEKVFQEARKILAAQMQHITYNEFLPILLGTEYSKAKGIYSTFNFESDTYDDSVNPSIANYFAASVFRFAHTLLPPLRGRDHGLPSYSVFRKHCKLPPADTWEELKKTVDAESFKSIKSVFGHRRSLWKLIS